jgi:four helix bundle protein
MRTTAAAGFHSRMADYRKLRVWERSAQLAVRILATADIAKAAGHSRLSEQMKGSAESISSNIAEGSGHESRKEFARYITYAIASSCELENQLKLLYDIHVMNWKQYATLSEEVAAVRKMLRRLREKMDGE